MFTFTKWITAPALALGLMLATDSATADAQTICTPVGCYSTGGGFGIGLGYGTRSHYGYRSSYLPRYGYGSHYRSYRGHHDFYRPHVYRHRPYSHCLPGHWDYHRGRH